MRQLILVRHSAVQIDPAVPAPGWPLSAEGRTRCHGLATRLGSCQPNVIVTSIESKARETGQILASDLGVPWTTADNLHEHERQDVPYFDKAQFEAIMADFFARPDELVLGQETAGQARARFNSAVIDVLARYSHDNVAIVAHGTVITLFLSHHNPGLAPFPFWQALTLPCYFVLSLPDMVLLDAVFYKEEAQEEIGD